MWSGYLRPRLTVASTSSIRASARRASGRTDPRRTCVRFDPDPYRHRPGLTDPRRMSIGIVNDEKPIELLEHRRYRERARHRPLSSTANTPLQRLLLGGKELRRTLERRATTS